MVIAKIVFSGKITHVSFIIAPPRKRGTRENITTRTQRAGSPEIKEINRAAAAATGARSEVVGFE